MNSKEIYALLALIGVVGIAVVFFQNTNTIATFEACVQAGNPVMESYPRTCRVGEQTFTEDIGNELAKRDLVRIHHPRPNQLVTSPLVIEGEARGFWFFEASFPFEIVDEEGSRVAQHYIMTADDWMTEDFVSFKTEIEFTTDAKTGTLILHRDNPSGLPEHDDSLIIPVRFK